MMTIRASLTFVRPLFVALLLVACGGRVDAPTPCDEGWERYDLQPGECLAAWTSGYNWREFMTRTCAKCERDASFGHGIHVDQRPDDGLCNDVRQFGELVRAKDEPISVSIKVDDGTVEILRGADCDVMRAGFDSY